MRVRGNGKPDGASSPGFTLIELLVVLAVIALLLSILIPSLHRARITAYRAGCASNMRQINLGLNMYLDDSDGIYPCAEDPVSVEPVYWLWMGRGWRPFVLPYLGGSLDARDPPSCCVPRIAAIRPCTNRPATPTRWPFTTAPSRSTP